MKVRGKDYKTVWMSGSSVFLIEQNLLPFEFTIYEAKDYKDSCRAIKTMIVRGAGAIGATAAYAMAQAAMSAPEAGYRAFLEQARQEIEATRPTAQNLFFATARVFKAALQSVRAAVDEARAVAKEDELASQNIGLYGSSLIKDGSKLATHCNAGWLAFVNYGTALSPIYQAHRSGKEVFVWVDETRPRSQGARLTAWELYNEGVPHKIVPDNAGAYLMAQQQIDMFIVGADRIAANGDVANKIGTLEKAIVAKAFKVPFYVAAPSSTFDLACESGESIPIEKRSPDEVLYQTGLTDDGRKERILLYSPDSAAFNPAFDVTPAEYITGIITEHGIIAPNREAIQELFAKTDK